MITAIFSFISAMVGYILWFVTKILDFVFSLPVWFLVLTHITGLLGTVGIIGLIVSVVKKSKHTKNSPY